MKALSKKRGRGRPRNENVIREPNGKPSRSKDPPSRLALEVRARMHQITVDQAMDQQAGQWLGRLHMEYLQWRKGSRAAKQPAMSISTAQYHAILTYQQCHNDHAKAVGSPGAVYEARGGLAGSDPDAHARWCQAVMDAYDNARSAIQAAQNFDPGNLWAALDHCVVQEAEMPHMIGDLRTLGTTLSRHYKTR